ncbi:DNA cytosine methyltransferase, partial [Clostridium perfringens]
PIPDLIRRDAEKIGYKIIDNIKEYAQIDISDFGVPQARKRIILIGLNTECFKNTSDVFERFYKLILPSYKEKNKVSVYEAIHDLPEIRPLDEINIKKK